MLTDDELKLIKKSEEEIIAYTLKNTEKERLYYQKDKVKDLGVNTPDELQDLEIHLGWVTAAVDVVLERLTFSAFYSLEDQETAEWLNKIYSDNEFEQTQKNHQRDAMITGAGFIVVGIGNPDEGEPEVIWSSESSSTMTAHYDIRSRSINDAFKIVRGEKISYGTLFKKDETLYVVRIGDNDWQLMEDGRDEHNLGFVSVIPIFNNADLTYPKGRSEMSHEIIGLQASAKRTLLNVEVSREYYSSPLRAIMGVNPNDIKSLQMAGKNLVIETTAGDVHVINGFETGTGTEGQWHTPQLQELTGGSPESVMALIEPYGKLAARAIGVSPSYMGFDTVNPESEPAINAADTKLLKRVRARTPLYKEAYKKLAIMSAKVAGRELDPKLYGIDVVFERPDITTPSAAADRLSKMLAAGMMERVLPDFMYRELGLTDSQIKDMKKIVRDSQAANSIALLAQNAAVTPVTNAGA